MQLLLFRHGIAQAAGTGTPDAQRALTGEGVTQTTRAARGLARLLDRPDAILTSPLRRAAQTADILGQVFDLAPQVMRELAYGPAGTVIQALVSRTEATLLLVGHNPTLSEMVEILCTRAAPRGFVGLKKAGCACLQCPDLPQHRAGGSQLSWLATPRMLRKLADSDS